MTLADLYPQPDDLIKSECDTLRYLMNDHVLNAEHYEFAIAAKRSYGQIYKTRPYFSFDSHLNVLHQGKSLMLIVSGLVERIGKADYGNITYCLAVCHQDDSKLQILRKFHFDAVSYVDPNRNQSHPVCHLQYCGSLLPYLSALGCKEEQMIEMHSWLSEPRILYWPTSLALITDLAFREFPSDVGRKFRERPEWQSIVRKNEALLLTNFHKHCLEIIKASKGTLAEALYVN
jgi:hypothetical protein